MANELKGRSVAFLVAPDGIEQVELTEPWRAIEEAGGTPRLISTSPGMAQGRDHLEKADRFRIDATVDEISAEDFDALVLPGGVANPDLLRTHQGAVAFVRSCCELGMPVAAICHGPWTLVEADVVDDRTLTSWPSLRTDIRNAGGNWINEEVVVDSDAPNVLVSSRRPDDLKAFCEEAVDVFAAA
jgi:protease I